MLVKEIRFGLQCVTVFRESKQLAIHFILSFLTSAFLTAINAWGAVKRMLLVVKLFYGKSTGFCTIILPKYFMVLTQILKSQLCYSSRWLIYNSLFFTRSKYLFKKTQTFPAFLPSLF